jgi:DNA repair exonuclease SbcCD ATPase subunit
VHHYEREIELNKIKIGELYEADIESLKSQLENSYANHAREVEELNQLLKNTREKLAREVQDRLDQRRDYELRLTEFSVGHDRVQRELKNVVNQREKEIEGHTSKASLTHISHNQLLQTRNIDMKSLMEEKRNMENKINKKNQEIETLNLKVQQMQGFHKRAIDKLDEEINDIKKEHNDWLERQARETNEWHAERKELNDKIDELNKTIHDIKKINSDREHKLQETIDQKGMEIANLNGVIEELEKKVRQLASKNQVEVENVEKTMLETRTLMNTEKEKLMETSKLEKHLQHDENTRLKSELEKQMEDLKK